GAGVTHNPEAVRIARELGDPDLTVERRLQLAAELGKVAVTGAGTKELHPENWEVLHEADDGRLAELGLERDRVAEHTPAPAPAPTWSGATCRWTWCSASSPTPA